MYPVIVIGPPRSGTTSVSQVLQDFFGVLMDGSPLPPPSGIHRFRWFEDRRLIEMNFLLVNGMIKMNAWTRRFKRFIRSMQRQRKEWGFKDPRLIPLLPYVLSFFHSPTIIRCHRDKKLVIQSCIQKLGWSKKEAKEYYHTHEATLDTVLNNRPHYRIDFGPVIDEEQIIEMFSSGAMLRRAA